MITAITNVKDLELISGGFSSNVRIRSGGRGQPSIVTDGNGSALTGDARQEAIDSANAIRVARREEVNADRAARGFRLLRPVTLFS